MAGREKKRRYKKRLRSAKVRDNAGCFEKIGLQGPTI
jgi:hypothetical protein